MRRLQTLLATLAVAACCALAAPAASAGEFDASDEDQDHYVQGNLLFLTYHEVGHLLIDTLLGMNQRDNRYSAEEMADDVAVWLMLPDPGEEGQEAEILAAMDGWLDSAAEQTDSIPNPHYPDDAERAARIACYLYGSDPQRYSPLAQTFRNSIQSADCPAEHAALNADVDAWFGPHLVDAAPAGSGRINVSYAEAPPALTEARDYLMQTRILDEAAEDINQFVRLPANVTLVARSCGGAAAEFRYNMARREITACYEAVLWFMGEALEETSTQSSAEELGSGGSRVKQRPRPRPR